MAGISVPPAINYLSPLVAVPTKYMNTPPEGPKFIPGEIDWGSMGGANNVVNFNLQNNAALNFSQITTIAVDNSQCGADIVFIFPDTAETTTVPAYTPKLIIPVFTNQTQFYVQALGTVLSTDITRFSIHNTLPPPVAVPTTQEQNAAVVTGSLLQPGTTAIVPAGTNGTLEGISITATVTNAAAQFACLFSLQDGSSKSLWSGYIAGTTGGAFNDNWNLNQLNVRFSNGINLVQSGSSPGGQVQCNLYYRKP